MALDKLIFAVAMGADAGNIGGFEGYFWQF